MWRLVRFDQRQIEEWTIPKREEAQALFLIILLARPHLPSAHIGRLYLLYTLAEERIRKKYGRCNNT
jgi:hypothetical protein